MNRVIVLGGIVLMSACAALAGEGPWESPKKKIVASSWDLGCVSVEDVLEHADQFDKTGLDGVVLRVPYVTDSTGKRIQLSHEDGVMASTHITEGTFGKYVPLFQAIVKHPSLRHSFFGCNWSPVHGSGISWTNDAQWAQFAANMKVMASIAKRGGLVGICADAEDYGGQGQYYRKTGDAPFDVMGPLARERGRQIGRAIFGEFPNAKILSFWFLSLKKSYAFSADPAAAMRANGDLWPMFMNGLLDVMPPEATLIDGDEHGYWFKTGKSAYARENVRMKTRSLALIAPENRAKYRAQVQAGFGLYLDDYINPKKVSYRTKNGSAVEAFREQLEEELYAADEYVWLWGEKHSWVTWKKFKCPYGWMKISKQTWEERLPGFNQVMREAKNPELEIANMLIRCRAVGATNLVQKSILSKDANWKNEKRPLGTFTPMPGQGTDGGTAVRAEGVLSGCYIIGADRPVTEGETYVAEAYVRGQGVENFTIRWKDNGTWRWHSEQETDAAFGAPDAQGWRRAILKARVPQGVNMLVLKIDVGQKPGESAILERVSVYRVE